MPDTSDNNATRVKQVRHECNTSALLVLHERHECDTSATQMTRVKKLLILITTGVKTCFHIPIFTIWQVKDYKERNNFILSTTFKNASFAYQNKFEKCPQKLEFVMVRAISKSYTLDCSCKSPCALPHSCA